MPSTDDLHAAGLRAAAQPVPTAPPVDLLQQRAGKHQSKRRLVGSAVVALVFVALAVPAALSMRSESVVQQVATIAVSNTGESAAQGEGGNGSGDATAAVSAQDESDMPADESTSRFEVRLGDDLSFAVRVLTGDPATTAAASAEAAAEETRTVDGETVWITRDGDQATVSSLIESGKFIEVTGPGDQLDRLLDMAANGPPELPPLPPIPRLPEIESFFDEFEGFEGFEGFEDFAGDEFFERLEERFGEGFDFNFEFDHDGDGEHPRFDFNFGQPGERPDFDFFFEGDFGDALSQGDFSKLEEFFDTLERDLPDFRQQLEDGEFGGHPFFNAENFDGCVSINTDHDGETLTFEFPPGCSAN